MLDEGGGTEQSGENWGWVKSEMTDTSFPWVGAGSLTVSGELSNTRGLWPPRSSACTLRVWTKANDWPSKDRLSEMQKDRGSVTVKVDLCQGRYWVLT